jgi:hypothetical protein
MLASPSRRWCIASALAAWCVAACAASGAASDDDEAPPAASRWGDFPAPSDSTAAALRNSPTPLWEQTLLVPYTVAALPLRALAAGAGATVAYLDDRHVIYRIGRLLRPRTGPFGVLINFTAGGLTGLGGGTTVVHDAFFGHDNRFKAYVQATTRGARKATLGIRLGEADDGQIELGAGYRLQANARYFGIGPEAQGAAESYYTQELTWLGASYNRSLGGDFASEAGVLLSTLGARGPEDDEEDAPIATVHAGALPPGYRARSDGVTLSVGLRRDTTVEEGRPEQGGTQRLRVARFEAVDETDVAFWSYRGEVEQFVPLWFSRRALALRGYASWIDPSRHDDVPFQRLMTNDDPDLLRGFRDFRWRDRGMAAVTVEYRWPIWAEKRADGLGLDAYLLADLGQVFGDLDEIALDDLTTSFGGGARLLSVTGGFLGRLEYARSREESVVRLRADQVFQFARNGLYHGRNPIPSR